MPDSSQKLEYHGTGGTLLGISIVNLLLTILTLGIYSFWARTKLRRYFYAETELAGDRFAYHGTAMELLRGWLRAIGVLILVGIVFAGLFALVGSTSENAAPTPRQVFLQLGVSVLYMATLATLVAIAVNGARRYRFSRSSWRSIRFSFRGRWQDLPSVGDPRRPAERHHAEPLLPVLPEPVTRLPGGPHPVRLAQVRV